MLSRIITVEGYELITIQQAAELCGVTFDAVYKWVRSGEIEIRAIVGRVKLLDMNEVCEASDSFKKRKPRSGDKK